ncbi:Pre-mRNA splicing factor [Aphelenchoides avenae]|nr:Pre-mRNA splicing factor [Aphelenchus avenae]
MADDPKVQWMYEGPKSSVNREDYLLGKKIDKNFELYSDVLIRDKDEKADDVFKQGPQIKKLAQDPVARSSKVSALNVDVVRIEDPLVALKMREEHKKRELLDNPLMKMKAQRILKSVYEKEKEKSKKHGKKEKKKHKHRSRSSSSSESDRDERRSRKRRHSDGHDDRGHRRHHDSKSSRERDETESRNSERHSTERHRKHSEDQRPSSSKSSSRKPLSAEELEERRRAMMGNAEWRDKVRDENLQRAKERQEREEKLAEQASAPTFIKPLVDSAVELSVEDRLSRNKNKIQRSHDYMDKSFARK